jgi:hypothetical protein
MLAHDVHCLASESLFQSHGTARTPHYSSIQKLERLV